MANASTREKEELFQELDTELHDSSETSTAWQNRALKAELRNERYGYIIADLREQIAEFTHRG